MRTLKTSGCIILSCAMLVSAGCGGRTAYVKKGSEQISKTIVLNNCTATPDMAAVYQSDTITWSSSDGAIYTVFFGSTAPVATNPSSVGSTPVSQPVKKSFGCWVSWDNCYYGYTLTKNNVACPDPGVHIIPGPQ